MVKPFSAIKELHALTTEEDLGDFQHTLSFSHSSYRLPLHHKVAHSTSGNFFTLLTCTKEIVVSGREVDTRDNQKPNHTVKRMVEKSII